MTFIFRSTIKAASISFLALPLFLAACANTPEPHSQNERAQGEKTSMRNMRMQREGLFIRPISLVFADMDFNEDKHLSRLELDEGIDREWAYFDRAPSAVYFANWSMETFGSKDANPTFMMFDKNLNGVVTKEEFSDLFIERFQRMDKNNDEILERSELIVTFEAKRGDRTGQERRTFERRGQRGGGRLPR